jgi:hypothetical protein
MATKHVIAYVMHVAERDLAARQVENAQVTDSYVIGDIDEERIQELEGAGLVVDEVAPAGRPTTNAMARGTMSAERGTWGGGSGLRHLFATAASPRPPSHPHIETKSFKAAGGMPIVS